MYKDAATCKNNGHDVPDIHSSTHTHTHPEACKLFTKLNVI